MEGLKRGDVVVVPLQGDNGKPAAGNGLKVRSQVMIDKPYTVARDRIGARIGRLDEATLLQINRSMMVWLGLP